MSEINYSRYREYTAARVEANNAMIALLAGSRLAAHNLKLHSGSPHQLPGLFPSVADIDRFNLLPDRASDLLLEADAHLSAVAIPYALAVYEAFVKDSCELLAKDRFEIDTSRRALAAGRMHDTFYTAAGEIPPMDTIALFHVLRCARNSQIHHAGVVTKELRDSVDALNALQRERWERLTMAPLEAMFRGEKLHFSIGHLIASFAITKEAARSVNSTLGRVLSRTLWAELAVADFAQTATSPRNSEHWKKSLIGFVRFNYLGELNLSEAELQEAARRTQAWTRSAW